MSTVPFRVGTSDLLIYGHDAAVLRVHAIHEESLMLMTKPRVRLADSSLVIHDDEIQGLLHLATKVLILNPGEKRALKVDFTPTDGMEFGIGKLIVSALRLDDEKQLGVFQIPVLAIGKQTNLKFGLLEERTQLSVCNVGTAPGFVYFKGRLTYVSEGDSITLPGLADGDTVVSGPVLVRSLLACLPDVSLTELTLQRECYEALAAKSDGNATEMLSHSESLARAIYSAYTSYPFRTNLLLFMLGQCLYQRVVGDAIIREPFVLTPTVEDAIKKSIRATSTSTDSGTDPLKASSSMTSVSAQPLASSARPFGGVSTQMLTSSDSNQMPTHHPIPIPLAHSMPGIPALPEDIPSRQSLLSSSSRSSAKTMAAPQSMDTGLERSFTLCDLSQNAQGTEVKVDLASESATEQSRTVAEAVPLDDLDEMHSNSHTPGTASDTYNQLSSSIYTRSPAGVRKANLASNDDSVPTLPSASPDSIASEPRSVRIVSPPTVLPRYDLEYKVASPASTEKERELIDQYNKTLLEYRTLSQSIQANCSQVDKYVGDTLSSRNSTPFSLEVDDSEYLPNFRQIPITYAEDALVYVSNMEKADFDGIPIHARRSSKTTYWTVLEPSFILNGVSAQPPYVEVHQGLKSIGGIIYLTGAVTIENNAHQTGFYDTLCSEGKLDLASEELAYLYYNIKFVTCRPEDTQVRLSISADKPLFGRVAPGQRETIAITLAIGYTTENREDRADPELPLFLHGAQNHPTLFLRVFGARFDRVTSKDNLAELLALQKAMRPKSECSVRETMDLPVRLLPGSVHGTRFSLRFMRFLATLPRLDTPSMSIIFEEVFLSLPEADAIEKSCRDTALARSIVQTDLHRSLRASLSGSDVLFVSAQSPSRSQRKRAASTGGCLQQPRSSMQYCTRSVSLVLHRQEIGTFALGARKIAIYVTPRRTPEIQGLIDDTLRNGSLEDQPLPILSSAISACVRINGLDGTMPEAVLDLDQYMPNLTALVATVCFTLCLSNRAIHWLIARLQTAARLPCYLHQEYEIHFQPVEKVQIPGATFPLFVRIPLRIDQSSIFFARPPPSSRTGRLLAEQGLVRPPEASIYISTLARNLGSVNGHVDGLWSESHQVSFTSVFAGSESVASLTLHNGTDIPIIAVLSGLSLPFSYTTACRIEPLSSLIVPLKFRPKRPGEYAGRLTISYQRVVTDRKQQEILYERDIRERQYRPNPNEPNHALGNEHYIEAEQCRRMFYSGVGAERRAKSAQMWDNMHVRPSMVRERGVSSVVEPSQVVPVLNRSFYVFLQGRCENTPVLITQPQNQLSSRNGNTDTIFLSQASRAGRLFIRNTTNKQIAYDVQLLWPGVHPLDHSTAYDVMTVLPASGLIEGGAQTTISLQWNTPDRVGSIPSVIVLNLYVRYHSGKGVMKALVYRAFVRRDDR
ncbi:hypothetical protein GMRT_10069 [Giardia muris]|uniref:Uncharacterized protein n=1 Tax=Giardia muris TaxID=5742 RepID=A0A4Z1SQ47_GIAMU|nr:hypothetical protein GMRT_10069 [Giardia muris]|eukprot:TNJ27962.1 hypothetical protein GMRT_10069 [Giardia muris]